MINLLKKAAKLNLFTSLDIQLAIRLVNSENYLLLLIFALLSAWTRSGHVCLFINKLHPVHFFEGRYIEIAFTLWEKAGMPNNAIIYTELKKSNAISESGQPIARPLVLFGNKLYFQRMWFDEGLVASFFSRNLLETVNERLLSIILVDLFNFFHLHDWQKIAVAVAITSKVSIISGGPGTGKTTIIAYLLVALIKLNYKKLTIQLATPTGKAAAKLTESLNDILLKLNLSINEQADIPKQAQTIHRLLGARLYNQSLRYNKDNKLLLDVLIIDEASMVDLSTMARLIEAIPEHTKVILLGDKDQLSSIEGGAIFSDLCCFSENRYSHERAIQLARITHCNLSDFISKNTLKIKDSICLLQKNYRFKAKSEIGQLATAIIQNNMEYVNQLLIESNENIKFHSIDSPDKYNELFLDAITNYRYYLDKIKSNSDFNEILNIFNRYRLLAALKDGPYGIMWLNYKLEQFLYYQENKQHPIYTWNKNYEGRPIMITKNDYSLGLFNGDIGIILRNEQQDLMAYFRLSNGVIKKILPNRLPQHQTAFVMTVHKAQGSEFDHIALVLPPKFTPILTRELIYTAITRAKKQLTIYANPDIFTKSLTLSIKRQSGLIERLNE